MGNSRLVWTPVHLWLDNELKILPISRLPQISVEVEGLQTYENFYVIDIFDNKKLYPTLMGIDWAIENQTIINSKKRILSFEDSEMQVVATIYPL